MKLTLYVLNEEGKLTTGIPPTGRQAVDSAKGIV